MSNNPWADGREGWEQVPRPGESSRRPDVALDALENEEEKAWADRDGPRADADARETNPFKKKAQDEIAKPEGPNPWSDANDDIWSPVDPSRATTETQIPAKELENKPQNEPQNETENKTAKGKTPDHEPPSPLLISLADDSSPAWDEDRDPAHEPDGQKGKGKADWNLIDAEEPAPTLPPLPPRRPTDPPSWKPSRQPVDGAETYQVKNIKWHDANSPKNPRTSPILIQNANGPCPLVALVNALTLTTPSDKTETALVQVLRSREQVSLALLLDAVFDELMRRTNSEDALPDVSDLYAFLQSLHTGMNVNPRFIPTDKMISAYKRTSLTHLHPTERGELIPGTFENTAEMSLYATFSIPLIHGWLPAKSEPSYEALARQAASYEDAQNLLFREEELERKLSDAGAGLDEAEQQLYQDIVIIKDFLFSSATQLTHWGIEVIGKAIRPGTFAIMFRNDHFSTLYCHPETMQLLTLVTDAGFRSHEIVWETLSDINGERTEYLSGDFKMVGRGAPEGGGGEWTTVHRGKAKEEPLSPSTEQEDRDLALALQLQEEEDERHRAAEARRRRESILSEQYIEQQGRQPTPAGRGGGQGGGQGGRGYPGRGQPLTQPQPAGRGRGRGQSDATLRSGLVPLRTSSTAGPRTQQVRSLIPPQTQGVTQGVTRLPVTATTRPGVSRPPPDDADDAPPSYEEAAHDRAYQPPMGHPSHANSPTVSRQSTTTSMHNAPTGQRPAGRTAARPPVNPAAVLGSGGGGGASRDRDCIVM